MRILKPEDFLISMVHHFFLRENASKIIMITPSEKNHPWDDDDHIHFPFAQVRWKKRREWQCLWEEPKEGGGMKFDEDDHRSFSLSLFLFLSIVKTKNEEKWSEEEEERQMSQIIDFQFFLESCFSFYTEAEKAEKKKENDEEEKNVSRAKTRTKRSSKWCRYMLIISSLSFFMILLVLYPSFNYSKTTFSSVPSVSL